MFNCPYQHCDRTFSRCTSLREHTKSHKGQAYWEILNSISGDSSNENLKDINNHTEDDINVHVLYNDKDDYEEFEQFERMKETVIMF
jgi:hypothetical protein